MNPTILEMIDSFENNNMIELEKKIKAYFTKEYSLIPLQKLIELEAVVVPKPIITKNFNGINGLWYIQNYLSRNEIETIKNYINNETNLEPISNKNKSRRVAHFGYYYSYDRTGLKEAPPIPLDLKKLASVERINKLINLDINSFDQVIINEYNPGQQIAYHTDHTKLFGPVISCITIGQSVPIYFRLGSEEKELLIEEGSMYIMTEDARYKWQHSLKNNSTGTRYSITYRTINQKN